MSGGSLRAWFAATPEFVLRAAAAAIIGFAVRQELRGNEVDRRLAVIETKVTAIAETVGATPTTEGPVQHAAR
jgi:hypothetical protein